MPAPHHEFSDPGDEPVRPDASRLGEGMGADEVELEATYGTDIWDSPQASLAEDVVAMRELERLGIGDEFFFEAVGEAELQHLLKQAEDEGDFDRATKYAVALTARNSTLLRRALGVDTDPSTPDEPHPDPEPPVTTPLQPNQLKGPTHKSNTGHPHQ